MRIDIQNFVLTICAISLGFADENALVEFISTENSD